MRSTPAVLLTLVAACSQSSPPRLELVDAPATGDLAHLVAAERTRAIADGKQLIVYVGAAWCEPCRMFHEAAANGQLDDRLGQLRLIVFDQDRDETALRNAGYVSQLIPLFVVPSPDGRATGRHIEGGTKDANAVDQIVARLRTLVQ